MLKINQRIQVLRSVILLTSAMGIGIGSLANPFIQLANAGVDDDFANGRIIQLATPNRLRVNMHEDRNGTSVIGLEADGTDDQRFVVEWQPGYGFKLRKYGTYFYVTSQNYPQKNLGLIEGWTKTPDNNVSATFIASPSNKIGFYNICFKYQPKQCLNLPNQARLNRFTTYFKNPQDLDQQFQSIVGFQSISPVSSNLQTPYFQNEAVFWNAAMWDIQSGDQDQFDGNEVTKGKNTGIGESLPFVQKISRDLSKTLFGYEAPMTAGYAYEVSRTASYNGNNIVHAGIDYEAKSNDDVFTVVPGRIIEVTSYKGMGKFVTVESADGNRWVYGHVNPAKEKGSSLKAGELIGKVVYQETGTHFHMEVHNSPFDDEKIIGGITYGTLGHDLNFVLQRSMSPLAAYWLWRNPKLYRPV